MKLFTKDGSWVSLAFHLAGIYQPLVCVSRLIDEGWKVSFDIEG